MTLEIRNLTIRSRTRTLVRDLSFSLPEDGITALIGPSGCGKTSVLKWLAGILPTPLLDAFGLTGTGAQFPAQLSGGMRQRVAFLRTIICESRYVLLDEPFSALDAVTRLRMQDWLAARLKAQPRALLLVTHDLHEATGLADRILVMSATDDAGGPANITADIPIPLPRSARSEAALAPLRDTLKTLLLKETAQ